MELGVSIEELLSNGIVISGISARGASPQV